MNFYADTVKPRKEIERGRPSSMKAAEDRAGTVTGPPDVPHTPPKGASQYERKYSRGAAISTKMEPEEMGIGKNPLSEAAYRHITGEAVPHSAGNKYISEQIGVLEEQIRSIAKRQSLFIEEERANRGRADNSIKISNDQLSLTIAELTQKISGLEAEIRRGEQVNEDLNDKLRSVEQNNKEMQVFMKTVQSQTENELTQMREIVNEKFGEDQVIHVKNKEKNVALFNEVVRLGQETEKIGEAQRGVEKVIEVKISELEGKSQKNEDRISNAENLATNFSNMLGGYSEKVEKRVSDLENGFHMIMVLFSSIVYF